jgi:hypothetical protein
LKIEKIKKEEVMGYRTYEMKFRDFLKRLEEGWGWWKPWYPRNAASALKGLLSSFSSELDEYPVRVIYETGTRGSLPWYYYEWYKWTIENIQLLPYINLSSSKFLKMKDEPEWIIIYHPDCKMIFYKNEEKFEIWLEWEIRRL